jgi:hypothetical protein
VARRAHDHDALDRRGAANEEGGTHRHGALPIEKANDRPLVLNTPRMREWEDDGSEQPKGTYGEDIAR